MGPGIVVVCILGLLVLLIRAAIRLNRPEEEASYEEVSSYDEGQPSFVMEEGGVAPERPAFSDGPFDDPFEVGSEEDAPTTTMTPREMYEADTAATRRLTVDILTTLGCAPEMNEDGSIFMKFQGETFHVMFGGRLVRIWDPTWASLKETDSAFPLLREAMNMTNFKGGPAIVMTAADAEGDRYLHSRHEIMLHPACPDNLHYLKSTLELFFDIKEELRHNFQSMKMRQNSSN